MTPLQWALLPLRRYTEFDGRSQRAEYWWFVALLLPVSVPLVIWNELSLGSGGAVETVTQGLLAAVVLLLFIPSLAVMVRRLHDQNLSGWFVLTSFIPIFGGLIFLVLMLRDGTVGANRFGADPKGRTVPSLAALFD